MRYVRITKAEAKKRFEDGDRLYLCPCNMQPEKMAASIYYCYYPSFEEMLSIWTNRNASSFSGMYPHYYVTIDEIDQQRI